MFFNPAHKDHAERLSEQLRLAPAVTSDLFADVMAACERVARLAYTGTGCHLARLIAAEAWSDATLTLMELEMPNWKLRRLEYEDGGWVCSLSTEPNMPAAIDDTVDARHEVLPLAILSALLDARRRNGAVRETRSLTGPRLRPASEHMMCCDNFA